MVGRLEIKCRTFDGEQRFVSGIARGSEISLGVSGGGEVEGEKKALFRRLAFCLSVDVKPAGEERVGIEDLVFWKNRMKDQKDFGEFDRESE